MNLAADFFCHFCTQGTLHDLPDGDGRQRYVLHLLPVGDNSRIWHGHVCLLRNLVVHHLLHQRHCAGGALGECALIRIVRCIMEMRPALTRSQLFMWSKGCPT